MDSWVNDTRFFHVNLGICAAILFDKSMTTISKEELLKHGICRLTDDERYVEIKYGLTSRSRVYGERDTKRCGDFLLCMIMGGLLDFWTGRPLQIQGFVMNNRQPLGEKIVAEIKLPDPVVWKWPDVCSARKWSRCERARRQAIKHRNRVVMDEVINLAWPRKKDRR